MSRTLDYTILDVFAECALEGNPLAVFHDGRGLSTEAMQALARETNLSETAFVLPSTVPEQDRDEGVSVRFFTPKEELPFAGHPTLGTAAFLRLRHPALSHTDMVTLRLKVGDIPVHFKTENSDNRAGLYGSMRQRDPEFGAQYDPREVAEILGLPAEAILHNYRPQTVSTGNAFCIVALRDIETLSGLAIPQQEAKLWLRQRGIRWFYCVAPDSGTGGWRARMQWENGEDPATGSAAGPCIAWLVNAGLAASGVWTRILQGVEILRPSHLDVQATNNGAGIRDVMVAGRTIPVATGSFVLPG